MIKQKDFKDLFEQIKSGVFKPTTIWMHPDTFKDLCLPELHRLYILILKHGFTVMKQENHNTCIIIYFNHGKEIKSIIPIRLRY